MKEKPKQAATTKHCNTCGIDKPVEEFAKNTTNRDGRAGICKKCFRDKTNKKSEENRRLFPF
jgi:hypothetical protein